MRVPDTDSKGQLYIKKANWWVYVNNANDFPVYVSVERRYGKVEGQASELGVKQEEAAEIDEIKPHEDFLCESDEVPVTLYGLRYYQGEVDCKLKFGKSKEGLSKSYEFARKLKFLLCPDVRQMCDLGFVLS